MTYKARCTTPRPPRQARKQARRLGLDPDRPARRREAVLERSSIDECPACGAFVPGVDDRELFEGATYTCSRGCELAVGLTDEVPPMAFLHVQEHDGDSCHVHGCKHEELDDKCGLYQPKTSQ